MGRINDSHVFRCINNSNDEFISNMDIIEMVQVPSDIVTACDTAVHFDTLDCNVVPAIAESTGTADNEQLQSSNYKVELMNSESVGEDVLPLEMKNVTDYISLDGIYDVADINSWTIDGHEYSHFGQSDVFVDELIGSSGSVAQNSVVPMKNFDCKQIMCGVRGETLLDNDIGYEEMLASLSSGELRAFNNWMDSVIEKINRTMDFNEDGNPEPLTFSIPNVRSVIPLILRTFIAFDRYLIKQTLFCFNIQSCISRYFGPNSRLALRKNDCRTKHFRSATGNIKA